MDAESCGKDGMRDAPSCPSMSHGAPSRNPDAISQTKDDASGENGDSLQPDPFRHHQGRPFDAASKEGSHKSASGNWPSSLWRS